MDSRLSCMRYSDKSQLSCTLSRNIAPPILPERNGTVQIWETARGLPWRQTRANGHPDLRYSTCGAHFHRALWRYSRGCLPAQKAASGRENTRRRWLPHPGERRQQSGSRMACWTGRNSTAGHIERIPSDTGTKFLPAPALSWCHRFVFQRPRRPEFPPAPAG